MPVPLSLALLVLGLLHLASGRRPRTGRRTVACGVGLLLLFSNQFVSTHLVSPLERQFAAIPEFSPGSPVPPSLAGCALVVVLGGGNSEAAGIPATSKLSPSALGRIVEGVRILAVVPDAKLLVTGPGAPGSPSHASILSKAAVSLGVDPRRITLLETARDTEEEAWAIARLSGGRRVALVTSAWHMPRAAALMRKAGVDFVACPADFVSAAPSGTGVAWRRFGFDTESLSRSTYAVHEWIGLAWINLKKAFNS